MDFQGGQVVSLKPGKRRMETQGAGGRERARPGSQTWTSHLQQSRLCCQSVPEFPVTFYLSQRLCPLQPPRRWRREAWPGSRRQRPARPSAPFSLARGDPELGPCARGDARGASRLRAARSPLPASLGAARGEVTMRAPRPQVGSAPAAAGGPGMCEGREDGGGRRPLCATPSLYIAGRAAAGRALPGAACVPSLGR